MKGSGCIYFCRNTGALLAGSLFNVGRISCIDRPAIASPYLTKGTIHTGRAGAMQSVNLEIY